MIILMIPWFTDTINIMMVWFKKFQFQAYYFKDFGAPPQPPPPPFLLLLLLRVCVIVVVFVVVILANSQ